MFTKLRILFLFILVCLLGGWTHGNSNATKSLLGMNSSAVPEEMPFLNVLKQSGGWYTETTPGNDTGEEATLYSTFVNGNHYPTSLTTGGPCPGGPCPSHTFTAVSAYPMLAGNSFSYQGTSFPAGTYVLLYTGALNTATAGTIVVTTLGGSVTQTCPSTGRCVITGFNPAVNSRFRVMMTATDPTNIGNYINNIALIYAPDSTTSVVGVNETAFNSGVCMTQMNALCMNPTWVTLMSPFKVWRTMDWGNTAGSNATGANFNINWTDRSLVTWAFWNENEINDTTTGNPNGYPVEAQVAACNAINSDCWLNIPCQASNAYAQSEATLVSSILNAGLKVYPEFCNEIWNGGGLPSSISNYMATAGMAAFPTGATCPSGQGGPYTSNSSYQFAYGIQQQVVYTNYFYTTMGSSRVFRVLASQNGFLDRIRYTLVQQAGFCGGNASLWSGQAGANVDGLAVAPYFGNTNPLAWTADADGGLNKFFQEQNSGGVLPTANVTGNCGNGAGLTCGTSSAFTLTSGLTIPATPTNGTCLGLTFNQAAAGSGAVTLKVDGGNTYPLADWHGVAVGSGSNYDNFGASTPAVACFTNATSAGSVTAQWYLQGNLGYVGTFGNGYIAQAVDQWIGDLATINTYQPGLKMIAYESGQTYVPSTINGVGPDPTYLTWDSNAMRDSRMGTAYTTFYTDLKNNNSTNGVMVVFNSIGNFSSSGVWADLEAITQSTSPRYQANVSFH